MADLMHGLTSKSEHSARATPIFQVLFHKTLSPQTLKPLKTLSPQTLKPLSPQTLKPLSSQTLKPSNPQALKP